MKRNRPSQKKKGLNDKGKAEMKLNNRKEYTLEELERLLTERQRIFVREYVLHWNKTQAYLKAYPNNSLQSAGAEGVVILKKPWVAAYVDFVRKDYEKFCGISKAAQVEEYKKIAYANLDDYHKDWITLKEYSEISKAEKAAIKSIDVKTDKDGIVFVRVILHDKIAALDKIDKLLGYIEPKKLEHSGEVSGGTVVFLPTNERDVK